MKRSDVEWLGQVPAHWEVTRLGRFGKFLKGNGGTKDDEASSGIPCVRYGDLYTTHEFVVLQARSFVSKEKVKDYTSIRFGDVLFAASGETIDEIGKSAANLIPSEACCGGDVIIFRPSREVDARYIGYATDCLPSRIQKATMGRGITVMHVYGHQLKRLSLALPPFPEQTAIVRFLDYADRRIQRYIRAKQKLIALLEEQKQVIIHQAVTGEIDVRTSQPYPAYKDSGVEWLGEVPEHWEVIPFKRRVGFQEGPGIMAADFRESGIPLLRISCLREELATLNGCNYLDPEMVALRWNHFAIRRGDYLLSASASTGEVSLATADVVGAIPYTGIIRLWGRSQKAIMEYVRLFMISGLFQDQIYRAKSGVGIEHFGPKHLNRMIITLPSVAEQEAIVGVCQEAIAPLAGAIAGARREIALLREYRTRLIADVVTGKLDVRDAAAGLPEVDPLARGDVDDPLDTDMDSVLEELETVKEVTI